MKRQPVKPPAALPPPGGCRVLMAGLRPGLNG